MNLPPFPVDDQALALLAAAIHPGPDAERSSVGDLCALYSQMAGADPDAVDSVEDGGIRVMRDPQYHEHDIMDALINEVRRLRLGLGRQLVPGYLRGDGPCRDCGTVDNIVWFTDNVLWNTVVGGPGTRDDPGGLLCIPCFAVRADAAGFYVTGWRLLPEFHWETHDERNRRKANGETT